MRDDPKHAELGALVARLEFALDAAENKITIGPQAPQAGN